MKILDKMISTLLRLLPCAFDPTNMNPSNTGTIRLWAYKTTETIATVAGSGYFDAFTNQLKNGDIILVSDITVPTIDLIVVTSADNASTVTTLNGT